jgi:hypothetical protein
MLVDNSNQPGISTYHIFDIRIGSTLKKDRNHSIEPLSYCD